MAKKVNPDNLRFMKLVHYSDREITAIEPVLKSRDHRRAPFMKPNGIWLSDDDEYGWADRISCYS